MQGKKVTMMYQPDDDTGLGPWNPGITSEIPEEFLPLATVYRSDHVFTSVSEARELADFTGLKPQELVRFRPERLIVHEVLIRVMGCLSVPDGKVYEDLGINFRRMTGTIMSKYVAPVRMDILAAYQAEMTAAEVLITAELEAVFAPASAGASTNGPKPGLLARMFGSKPKKASKPVTSTAEQREHEAIDGWKRKARIAGGDELRRSAHDALTRMAGAITGRRGRLVGDTGLLKRLALTFFSNDRGSRCIGERIEECVYAAADGEGYKVLPNRAKPVIMNVKGASAAGKSTLRPLQRKLAEALELDWTDFALISPDIWRKYLLDYDSLGPATRYAGSLTGHEIEIIDVKLDEYMAARAARGALPHLLVDRFRFDSFSIQPHEADGGRLLTRFGDRVYMFFVITPPDATVERAWGRGNKFGRYKAVDDLLFHNVEAFTGMPQLFFTWAASVNKEVHYEFLDNSVPHKTRPRTVAFGCNQDMNILDVKFLLDVDRFRKINVEAKSPAEVYPDAEGMAAGNNTAFLAQVLRNIDRVQLADHATGRIYAWLEHARVVAVDPPSLKKALQNNDLRAAVEEVIPDLAGNLEGLERRKGSLDLNEIHTLGAWDGRG
jgi:hypothetical protein